MWPKATQTARVFKGGKAAAAASPAPVILPTIRTAAEIAENQPRTWRLYAHDSNCGKTTLIATRITTREAESYLHMTGHRRMWPTLWNEHCLSIEFQVPGGTARYLVVERGKLKAPG